LKLDWNPSISDVEDHVERSAEMPVVALAGEASSWHSIQNSAVEPPRMWTSAGRSLVVPGAQAAARAPCRRRVALKPPMSLISQPVTWRSSQFAMRLGMRW
jgi:hypothetical protein